MILDTGALIAVDRDERAMIAALRAAYEEGEELRTHAMVIAQVWRDDRGRQTRLARLLLAVDVVAIDDARGRRSGELLGRAKTSDPIDAAVVLVARDGDVVVTSDPEDIRLLARAAKRRVLVVAC